MRCNQRRRNGPLLKDGVCTKVPEQEIKGANMNPGEYEVNGIRYGWAHDLDEYEHRERIDGVWFRCARFPDIEKAEKARHELAEAERGEWVEIDDNARIQRDGSDPQVRREGGIWWRALTNSIDKRWPKAYRKGREVAQAEQAELRDDVRELVEAVTVASRCGVDYGGIVVNRAWFDYAVTAAKKVEAKL